MNNYIEKVLADSKPTAGGVVALDLDAFMSGLCFDNELRSVSNQFEFRKYRNSGVCASYSHRRNADIHVDFYWGLRGIEDVPVGYPKDGIGKNGKVIWESCFCITFLTRRSIERGRAKKVILPVFPHEARQRCYIKAQRVMNAQNVFCSLSQLQALVDILRRFDNTGDEVDIEFAPTIPCEMVVQNG